MKTLDIILIGFFDQFLAWLGRKGIRVLSLGRVDASEVSNFLCAFVGFNLFLLSGFLLYLGLHLLAGH